jgi:Holliday junction DNA helicase RuvB
VDPVERPYGDDRTSHPAHSLPAIQRGRWYRKPLLPTGTKEAVSRLHRPRALRYNPVAMRIERMADLTLEDQVALATVRPTRLEEFVGQEAVKEKLRIYIAATQARNEPLDHVLLLSPPGLGKTTLAYIIAAEMGVNLRVSSGPAIEKAGDLAAILTNLRPRDVLFIDEIHRLRTNVEEILYPAMEEYRIDVILGEGPNAQSLRIDLPPFTLIGATTRAGLISAPLRDRFEVSFRLDFYTPAELCSIILRAGRILGIEVDKDGAEELAKRARGTPRIANRLLRRTRDYAQVKKRGRIDPETARRSLEMLEIDEVGLDRLDRAVLDAIITKFSGGPVGLETLAAALAEEKDTIADVVEPYLLQEGFIQRTPQGRVATERACAHLGKGKPRLL